MRRLDAFLEGNVFFSKGKERPGGVAERRIGTIVAIVSIGGGITFPVIRVRFLHVGNIFRVL